MDAASATGIVKRFGGTTALDGVSVRVSPGVMTGLVGPDGAGKTTLIRIIAGLIDPDAGEAVVLGSPATRADRSRIGYMPQRFGLYEDLTVRENLRLYSDLRGLEPERREESDERLLEFADLKRFENRLAGDLSGGMKQKLGLACALVREPRLLLLDEPGVGVDPVSRRELWTMVSGLTGDGVGVLWSTAYLDEAESCDQVYLLQEGRLLHAGPPGDLMKRADGRIFRVEVPSADRRATMARLLERDDVEDATVQGSGVRLLMRSGSAPPLVDGHRVEPGRPRFEDGFIDVLGADTPATSALAAAYRTIGETGRPAIEAKALTRRYGDFTAARDIGFTVARGEIFGLLGPNGAGKSTTFKMLCGLLTPTSGTGSVDGYDLRTARADARQSLGYMAQKFSLYGDLSVRQNLDFFSGIYGLAGAARRRAIDLVVGVFHLERYLGVNAGAMPLGYRQRLALACAVMHEPPVLFLDEPTSGVDPVVRREFWGHINGLVGKGVAVLVTTHFMDEAEYCDRASLIYRAEQIAIGTPDELKARTGSETMEDAFVALIGAADGRREAA